MVHTTKDDRKIIIEVDGSIEELSRMQIALIGLIRARHLGEDETPIIQEDVYYALNLLEALLPTPEQQMLGFVRSNDYLELPENLSEKGRQALRTALHQIKNPDSLPLPKPNPVLLALNSI